MLNINNYQGNTKQNHTEISLSLHGHYMATTWPLLQRPFKTKYSRTGMDAEKLRMEAGTGIIDNGMGCPEKLKNTIAI